MGRFRLAAAALLAALLILAGCAGTPLMEAAGRGDLDQVKKLTKQGADLEEKGSVMGDYKTPLQMAAQNGQVEVVRYLLAQGADPNARGAYGATALYLAAERGRLECMKVLVLNGAEVDESSFFTRTALHGAAINGKPEIIAYLLDRGANVNARAYEKWTPLMLAATYNRDAAIRLLIVRGADPSLTNGDGETALAIARRKGNKKAIAALKGPARLGIRYRDIQGHVGHHMSAAPSATCPGGEWRAQGVRLVGGSLPEGLVLDGSIIEGTPQQPGRWLLRLRFSGVTCKGQPYGDELVRVPLVIKGYAPRRVD